MQGTYLIRWSSDVLCKDHLFFLLFLSKCCLGLGDFIIIGRLVAGVEAVVGGE